MGYALHETLALVDLRLPIYLVIAIVLLFGFAAWLSWEDDQADGAKAPLEPVDDEPWLSDDRRDWR